jgi:hypothetical protein
LNRTNARSSPGHAHDGAAGCRDHGAIMMKTIGGGRD